MVSYNVNENKLEKKVIRTITTAQREDMFELLMENGKRLVVSAEHPLYSKKKDKIGWGVLSKKNFKKCKIATHVKNPFELKEGDELFSLKKEWIKIVKIKELKKKIRTFNLWKIDGETNFFAEGFLASTYQNGGPKG